MIEKAIDAIAMEIRGDLFFKVSIKYFCKKPLNKISSIIGATISTRIQKLSDGKNGLKKSFKSLNFKT